jgi:hypothetical protein
LSPTSASINSTWLRFPDLAVSSRLLDIVPPCPFPFEAKCHEHPAGAVIWASSFPDASSSNVAAFLLLGDCLSDSERVFLTMPEFMADQALLFGPVQLLGSVAKYFDEANRPPSRRSFVV